jgi:hypothetical protein
MTKGTLQVLNSAAKSLETNYITMPYKDIGKQNHISLTQIHYLLNQHISLFKMVLILYFCYEKCRITHRIFIVYMTVHKSNAE